MYCERMRELYDQWVASSFDKQERSAPPGGWAWKCDLERGVVRLENVSGEFIEAPGQFLGRESECGARWTWSWAYPPGAVAPDALRSARRLRDFGRQKEILALIVPGFDLQGRCGHQLALIASGVTGAAHYVECETEEGSLYFLVEGRRYLRPEEDALNRIFRIFPAILRLPEVQIGDHVKAFRSYLEFYGLEVEMMRQPEGTVVSGSERGSRRLILGGFDKDGRPIGLAEARRTRRPRPRGC